jgi:ribose 5-phosphate isomerase A
MEIEARIARLAEAVAADIPAGLVIGLGSGSTAEAVVRALGRRVAEDPGFALVGIATSTRTATVAESAGIFLKDLSEVDSIDLGFDGADEIDADLNLVKGRGGALLYEKLVAEICRDYLVVSADDKLVDRLGTRLPLPIEVIPYGWIHTRRRLSALGLTPELRGGRESPYRTDAGNVILDCTPDGPADLVALAPRIKGITGVVEHGVFAGIAQRAALVNSAGVVNYRERIQAPFR